MVNEYIYVIGGYDYTQAFLMGLCIGIFGILVLQAMISLIKEIKAEAYTLEEIEEFGEQEE